jgi:hypothetical protein
MRKHGPVPVRCLRRVVSGLCLLGTSLFALAASAGVWQAVGIGDCTGHDVSSSRATMPDASKCDASFAGQTAVCWANGCTYKNVPVTQCKGGAAPGQMYTCSAYATAQPGRLSWQASGIGDCPGRDVAGTSGPVPDASKCNASFSGFTAVCWSNACTYKNVKTGQCIGGANPGQMYTCGMPAAGTASPPPPPANPNFNPNAGVANVGGWQAVGVGDCPGRDLAGSSGTTPEPSRCYTGSAAQTAVCWPQGCTYKSVATSACSGGANPGQMYTCPVAASTPSSSTPAVPIGVPKVFGKRYSVVNFKGDNETSHEFVIDWKSCKVAELNQDYERGNEDITVSICRPASRLVMKTENRKTGFWIQYDWIVLDNGATLAGSYKDPASCGPSAGKRGK